jgi:sarcosine oxidase subunit gamma
MTNKKEVLSEIGKNFIEKDFAVTDISHSKSIIELEGDEAKEVLKKGCPFNFNELYKNNCLNSTFNGMSIIVDMINDKPDTFRIFSLRSFGESLYHSLTDASLEFGYIGK